MSVLNVAYVGPEEFARALAKNGDADIKAQLKMPSNCIAPTIVVREVWEGKVGGWLAAAGY